MEAQSGLATKGQTSVHEDRIERLDPLFYVRWTSGPDYERAFICVEDAEPDMLAVAEVGFKQARIFVAAYRAGKTLPVLEMGTING